VPAHWRYGISARHSMVRGSGDSSRRDSSIRNQRPPTPDRPTRRRSLGPSRPLRRCHSAKARIRSILASLRCFSHATGVFSCATNRVSSGRGAALRPAGIQYGFGPNLTEERLGPTQGHECCRESRGGPTRPPGRQELWQKAAARLSNSAAINRLPHPIDRRPPDFERLRAL
jgi:hypothetical protein